MDKEISFEDLKLNYDKLSLKDNDILLVEIPEYFTQHMVMKLSYTIRDLLNSMKQDVSILMVPTRVTLKVLDYKQLVDLRDSLNEQIENMKDGR